MDLSSKIFIAGHGGIIENSLYEFFSKAGYQNVFSSSRDKLNILSQIEVENFFERERPDYVFLSSVRSGGIVANQAAPAEFIYENLESQNNIIHQAYMHGVKKLLYYASSCVYPKQCSQPMTEDLLMSGPFEETNAPYSIAKLAGIGLCQAYREQYGLRTIIMVPATIYGPGSCVDIKTAHVLGSLLSKFHTAVSSHASEVTVWGTGDPRREFLYVDDFISASMFLIEKYDEAGIINVGSGEDIPIQKLAELISGITGFTGKIVFDANQPDGVYQKLLDNSRIKELGWLPKVDLETGIQKTYDWVKAN